MVAGKTRVLCQQSCALALLLLLATSAANAHGYFDQLDSLWQLVAAANADGPGAIRTILEYNNTSNDLDSSFPQFLGTFLASSCPKTFGHKPTTVIMVADPGTFSGSPEAMHYLANLKSKREIPKTATMCASKVVGTLMGKPTAVIASGIGPVAAAICTIEVMLCGRYIKEIFYLGTSGWSPQLGGVLSVIPYSNGTSQSQTSRKHSLQSTESSSKPDFDQAVKFDSQRRKLQESEDDGCNSANPSRAVNRIGDICISAFAVNWMCKKAEYLGECSGYPSLCTLPHELSGPNASYLYGQCEFTAKTPGTITLADEIMFAAVSAIEEGITPQRDEKTQAWEESYFDALRNGTGVDYDYDANAPPTIFSYSQCVEVDGQFFYSGPPFEMVARKYAAETINTALNLELDMTQVIAVGAMEAIGLDDAIERYNKLAHVKPIPYISIRAMSNQLHAPVAKDDNGDWVYNSGVEEDYVSGYKFAIASESTALLNLFKLRCERLHGKGHKLCTFEVKYP